jgi:hypothetical protein
MINNLTCIYNGAAERRQSKLDFVGQERRHSLIIEQSRRENELAATIEFIDRAYSIKGVINR